MVGYGSKTVPGGIGRSDKPQTAFEHRSHARLYLLNLVLALLFPLVTLWFVLLFFLLAGVQRKNKERGGVRYLESPVSLGIVVSFFCFRVLSVKILKLPV